MINGEWLGLFPKDKHQELARIKIDISSSLDQEWTVDVKKSTIQPAAHIKELLKKVASPVVTKAKNVYIHSASGPRKKRKTATKTDIWLQNCDRIDLKVQEMGVLSNKINQV